MTEHALKMPREHFWKSRFSPSYGPFQISIWVIFPVFGLQRMAKNDQKWPKMAQNGPKHVQKPSGIIFENIDFRRFLDLYDPFQSFFGLVAFWGSCQNAKKCPKMPKMPNNCQTTPEYCPDSPPKWTKTPTRRVRRKWFLTVCGATDQKTTKNTKKN